MGEGSAVFFGLEIVSCSRSLTHHGSQPCCLTWRILILSLSHQLLQRTTQPVHLFSHPRRPFLLLLVFCLREIVERLLRRNCILTTKVSLQRRKFSRWILGPHGGWRVRIYLDLFNAFYQVQLHILDQVFQSLVGLLPLTFFYFTLLVCFLCLLQGSCQHPLKRFDFIGRIFDLFFYFLHLFH